MAKNITAEKPRDLTPAETELLESKPYEVYEFKTVMNQEVYVCRQGSVWHKLDGHFVYTWVPDYEKDQPFEDLLVDGSYLLAKMAGRYRDADPKPDPPETHLYLCVEHGEYFTVRCQNIDEAREEAMGWGGECIGLWSQELVESLGLAHG